MLCLTSQEISQYRSQLADYPEAIIALSEIENCEGDVEDATLNLGIRVGQQPDRTDWLLGLAKRCRVEICQDNLQQELENGNLIAVVDALIKAKICHPVLVTPVALYVMKQGVREFCEPLNYKIDLSLTDEQG
ncbi:hypothetical protein [Gloeothece verrucosa]|uniref:Uncharacterized protein n=1 Tax=Gloeothece verrucosa (strain PCC 7822) TaxID=497965 RepID=E0U7T6_GLOV7|nr:hypothetical protein [Gloeothece verrucosa]ADN14898.1 conserved hypothetical protein [Gloeothece verrucosa PCC 7822]